MELRPFLNSDPPFLAEIWRSQGRRNGLLQPVHTAHFEQYVLAKPYFDRHGLILAVDGNRRLGFVHAGFGPDEALRNLDTDLGVTCMLMVRGDEPFQEIAPQLLSASEAYLRGRGAKVLYGGAIAPLNPFYFGLYGGSELPGVLDSDQELQALYQARGYSTASRVLIFQQELSKFRPAVQRKQLALARSCEVHEEVNAPASNWWDACVLSGLEILLFRAIRIADRRVIAEAVFRDLGPLTGLMGVRAAGLVRLDVLEEFRRQGWGAHLVGTALRRLQLSGFNLVEVQTMDFNSAALGLYQKLGFQQTGGGAVFRQ